jgi:DNA-directed RNA polymerase specialized sigma24 family protein
MCPNLFFAGLFLNHFGRGKSHLDMSPMHVQTFRPTLHHPEGAEIFFDSPRVEQLIGEWKLTGKIETFEQILEQIFPMVRRLILSQKTNKLLLFEDLVSRVQVKLFKHLKGFDPAKGSAFSYLSKITKSVLCSAAVEVMRKPEFAELGDNVPEGSAPAPDHAVEDLAWRIRGIKTVCPQEETEVQRWIIQSIVDSAPTPLMRYEAAQACTFVFGINGRRARQIFDLTLLEVRRALLGPRQSVRFGLAELATTKSRFLIKYSAYL